MKIFHTILKDIVSFLDVEIQREDKQYSVKQSFRQINNNNDKVTPNKTLNTNRVTPGM